MSGVRWTGWRGWVALAAGGAAALGLGVVGVGALLPVAHTASISQRLAAPPAEVWALLDDVDAYPEWRPDVERVVRLDDGPAGASWREEGPGGALTFEVERREPPRSLVVRIADRGLPFGGRWRYEVSAEDGGARLTITEDGEVYSPLYRFVSRFVLGHDRTLRRYMDAARARLEGSGPGNGA